MKQPLLECRSCGVVGRYSADLCLPEPIDDGCADGVMEGAGSDAAQCLSIQELAPYRCAVCGRATVEATNVCLPSSPGTGLIRNRSSGVRPGPWPR